MSIQNTPEHPTPEPTCEVGCGVGYSTPKLPTQTPHLTPRHNPWSGHEKPPDPVGGSADPVTCDQHQTWPTRGGVRSTPQVRSGAHANQINKKEQHNELHN